jgi:Transposase, Mutator family
VEDEFDAWLVRARYERRPEYQRGLRNYESGMRNGFRPRTVQTAEGVLEIQIPQVREAAETFASKLFPRTPKLLRTEPLKALVIGAFVRGLSMRDVESLCEQAGLGKLSKSTASRMCRGAQGALRADQIAQPLRRQRGGGVSRRDVRLGLPPLVRCDGALADGARELAEHLRWSGAGWRLLPGATGEARAWEERRCWAFVGSDEICFPVTAKGRPAGCRDETCRSSRFRRGVLRRVRVARACRRDLCCWLMRTLWRSLHRAGAGARSRALPARPRFGLRGGGRWPPVSQAGAPMGSGRTRTVSATCMISVAGRPAAPAWRRIASGLVA